ncbi:protein of unknown function [Streptantibioticus cattleyicolor NRRL 8057 = DSM 46488]|nr:protein of unknown function [Streptantibioticus cattleyicolor NRRL 8057 = DSM 46488]
MSRMRSSKSSSGGVFVLRRAIARLLLGRDRNGCLTRSIVDRTTDSADHHPVRRRARGPWTPRHTGPRARTGDGNFAWCPCACLEWHHTT